MTKISVIGLGKLGACSAACFAAKGFDVIGVDINKDTIDAINDGKAPVYEPRLQELIDTSDSRLSATQDFKEAIEQTDVTFLIVPTPSREDGHFTDKYLQDSLKHLSEAFKTVHKKYHLFVITSTVSPQTTESSLIPLIESISGKRLHKHFGVCYNPEFIALGTVITDFLNPDLLLIGESDKQAGDQLEEIYKKVCENEPQINRMSIVSAEIAKISLNSYVTMKISFANTLSNICEKVPGSDVDAITKALGADKRISPFYLKGGMSFGGPCFPRDNRAFAAFAKKNSLDALLAKTTDMVNQFQTEHIFNQIMNFIPDSSNKSIAILGLSYKPLTPIVEESAGIKIIEELLKKKDIEIIVYDPLAMESARIYFGDNILYASSVKDCFQNASICVITTPDNLFKSIDRDYIIHKPTIIIDCWRMLDGENLGQNAKYIALGRNQI